MTAFRHKAIVNLVVWIGTLSYLLFALQKSEIAEAVDNVTTLLNPETIFIRLGIAILVVLLVAGFGMLWKDPSWRKLVVAFLTECSSLCMTLGALSFGAPFLIAAVSDGANVYCIFAILWWVAAAFYATSALFAWAARKIEAKIAGADLSDQSHAANVPPATRTESEGGGATASLDTVGVRTDSKVQ